MEFVDSQQLIKTQYKHYYCLFARIYVRPNIVDKVINNSAVKFVDNQLLIITLYKQYWCLLARIIDGALLTM